MEVHWIFPLEISEKLLKTIKIELKQPFKLGTKRRKSLKWDSEKKKAIKQSKAMKSEMVSPQ